MKRKQPPTLYTPAGFFLLRAPALPAITFTRISTAGHLSSETTPGVMDTALERSRNTCAEAILELASKPQIIQALAVASPSLTEGLARVQRNEGSPKRVLGSLLRYLIRMSTRPTPFGLFSGVALGTFGAETQAGLTLPAIAFRSRPDMGWLLTVLKRLEQDPALVAQLKVRSNQMVSLIGERAVLPLADIYGEQDQRAISLRATSMVRKVFELAQQFISYTELRTAMFHTFPNAAREHIEHMLWQLWEHHFLVSELHPPLTEAKPVAYVRNLLESLQGVDELKEHLSCIMERTASLDRAGVGAPISLISALVEALERLVPGGNAGRFPLQVDTALQIQSLSLHTSIGQVAARAAEFLLRQTPRPHGVLHLQEYRRLFLEKYGKQAEIPLLDLLSPEHGLDAPAGYENPLRTYARPSLLQPPKMDARDHLLQKLVAEAINNCDLEVELTEELQQHLERWSPQRGEAPPSLEIYLHLHAASREAIDRGTWTAVVGRNCGSPNGGRTFGRFFDLLGASGVEHMRDLAKREEALLPGVIFAELSYQPGKARLANVSIRPQLRSYEIAIGTSPSVGTENVLLLSDLVVGVQNGRFYVRSLRLGSQVRICQTHMLNLRSAPNVCRFLTEIASDGQPVLSPFDWGAAASSPFLPRLVIKVGTSARLVITPACWQICSETITPQGEGTAEVRWFCGLQYWRKQWRVPRYVYLTQGDNRLLLDLENPLMVAQLRDELHKPQGQRWIMLDEMLPDFDHLWLHDEFNAGYFSEIVVPLLRINTVDRAQRTETMEQVLTPPPRVISSVERKHFPGEDWVYLKLYAALSQHEEVLARPLRELVQRLQENQLVDRWFFLRYADPEPHLRLRFHAKGTTEQAAILALAFPWSLQLARSGQIQHYSLDTYEQEVERYGGPDAIDVLEQVFMVDSIVVGNLLSCQHSRHLTLDPLLVTVFTLNHFFASWGFDFRQRLEWTRRMSEKYAFSREFRSERTCYCDLLSPRGQLDPSLARQRVLLMELVHPQEASLSALGTCVRQLHEEGKLWTSESSLLKSLAHLHVNRLLGIDRKREQRVYAFWQHTLNSLHLRQ